MSEAAPPWQEEAMRALRRAHAAQRLPHALLIHEAPGAGGGQLAAWIARLVLCTAAEPPCGRCGACRSSREEQHPDLTCVRPIEDSQQIRIEQVRALGEELTLTSHQGGYKVALIEPADAMNRFAANALLKTLEEPAPRTLIVLVAQQPSRLPATIMSRCQRITLRAPSRAQSLEWLRATRGEGDWGAVLDVLGEAPLAAACLDPAEVKQLAEETVRGLQQAADGTADPVGLAERWSRSELALRLACFENWLTERIRRRLVGHKNPAEERSGAHSRAGDSVLNTQVLFQLLDRVRELKASLATPINRSLALESLLRSLRT